jgi:hypothetical protein
LMRRGTSGHRANPAGPDDYLPFSTAGLRAVDRITMTPSSGSRISVRTTRCCRGWMSRTSFTAARSPLVGSPAEIRAPTATQVVRACG